MQNFSIKELIYKSYQLSLSNFIKLSQLILVFAFLEIILDSWWGVSYKNEYIWLLPNENISLGSILLNTIRILIFAMFIICWARIISPQKKILNTLYYAKIVAFIGVWLVWHYVSFLGLYNLYFGRFAPFDLLIIIAGSYLPFVWVRFYSMLARLLDNQKIAHLSEFFYLTRGKVLKICIALLFVVIPCSMASWLFSIYYNGNIFIGGLCLNLILLFFTTIWINHCYTQREMLAK